MNDEQGRMPIPFLSSSIIAECARPVGCDVARSPDGMKCNPGQGKAGTKTPKKKRERRPPKKTMFPEYALLLPGYFYPAFIVSRSSFRRQR
ncbi:MAG: hypothetical protein HY527_09555 [Betaproteobacteria bacterium]|nr:hypothetical protein [Betaproteobacteria bacterium]